MQLKVLNGTQQQQSQFTHIFNAWNRYADNVIRKLVIYHKKKEYGWGI